jgi:taurine transport system permease protein
MNIALKFWSGYVRATHRWPIIATIVPFIPVVAIWSIVANSGMFPRAFFPAPVDVIRSFISRT